MDFCKLEVMQPHGRLEDFSIFFPFILKNYWQTEKKFSCETMGKKNNLETGSFRDQPHNLHILMIMFYIWQLTNGFGFSHTGGNIWYLGCSKWVSVLFFLREIKLLWISLVYTWKPTSCCHFCTFQNPTRDCSISQTTGLVNRRKYSHNLEKELLPRKIRKQLACPSGLGSSSFP